MSDFVDDWVTIRHGDAWELAAETPPNSVHCIVTSPPYWGLRDYGTATWVGGDPTCDHGIDVKNTDARYPMGNVCAKCGAVRVDAQCGLEATPDEWVARLVDLFALLWDVLRDDGTLWLNLGDAYARDSAKGGSGPTGKHRDYFGDAYDVAVGQRGLADGLKQKDLIGMPWMVAFALRAAGWYLRDDIIWHKPNPMPESVTDRPTRAHEYVFLLTKSPRYFFDAEAIAEDADPINFRESPAGRKIEGLPPGSSADTGFLNGRHFTKRRKRDVWTISTQPFAAAHFATFPPSLIEPCIKAGTSEHGVCPKCGSPWTRIVESSGGTVGTSWRDHEDDDVLGMRACNEAKGPSDYERKTTGWQASCACGDLEPVPAVVLDPFVGSGTTAAVARKLGRRALGFELNAEYIAIAAEHRLSQGQLL